MASHDCPSQGALADFAYGRLTDEQFDAVAEHAAECGDCENVVQSLEAESDNVFAVLRQVPPEYQFADESESKQSLERSKRIPDEHTLGRVRDYELLEEIGHGGMGTVYKARHVKLDRMVALKMLPIGRMDSQDAIERFLREMRAVGKLDHANIVRASDAGESDGTHYLAMELVDGIDLSRLVQKNGALAVPDACEIIRQVAVGLQHAHEHGLVHRDIKPSNLMLTSDGRVKILDLGLARFHDYITQGEELTREGQTLGTLDYMAPEQLDDSRAADIRADIYSMGATLYKLLCGEAPFAACKDTPTFKKAAAILASPVPSIKECCTGVPDELAGLLERCLAKEPDGRPSIPTEVADTLGPLATGSDLKALRENATISLAAPSSQSTALQSTSRYASQATDTDPTAGMDKLGTSARELNVPDARGRRSRLRRAAVPFGLVGIIAAAILVSVMTDNGELVIQSDEPDVQVLLKRVDDGKVVRHWQIAQGENRWTIRSGSYETALVGRKADELKIEDKQISMTRGGEIVARIYEPSKTLPPNTPTIPPEPIGIKRGEPLSRAALVKHPTPIDGLLSWTIALRQPRSFIYAVVFSPDGKLFASAGQDSSIRIWHGQARTLAKVLIGHSELIIALAWSPDGRYLASGGGSEARIWDIASGRLVKALHTTYLQSLDWSPDGETLAYADGNDVVLWSLRSKQPATRLTGHAAVVNAVAWSSDSKTLASGSKDQSVRLWNIASPKVRELNGHDGQVGALAWSQDGSTLVSYSQLPGELRFWRTADGAMLDRFAAAPYVLGSHALAWSRDRPTIVCFGTDNGTIHVWDAQWRRRIEVPQSIVSALDISPGGKTVVSGDWSGGISMFDIAPTSVSTYEVCRSIGALPDIDWSPDGKSIAVSRVPGYYASWSKQIRLIDPYTLSHTRTYGVKDGSGASQSWSPDGSRLAGIRHEEIVVWDKTGREIATQRGNRHNLHWPSWGSVGLLASGDNGGNVRVWDGSADHTVHSFEAHEGMTAVCIAPGGNHVASRGIMDKSVRIWDLRSGEAQNVGVDPETGSPQAGMAWSPDGNLLAFGEGKIVTAKTGKIVQTLGPWWPGRHSILAWSPDGRSILSGVHSYGAQCGLYSWNLETGEYRGLLSGDPIASASFSPDGSLIASAGESGTIWIVHASTGKVFAVICILSDDKYVSITVDGHYRGSPGIEDELLYVVQKEEGQETLTPEQFSSRYGWRNDPDKVRLPLVSAP